MADTKNLERSVTQTKIQDKKQKQAYDDIKELNIGKDDDEVAGAGQKKTKKTKGNPKHRIIMNEEERKQFMQMQNRQRREYFAGS